MTERRRRLTTDPCVSPAERIKVWELAVRFLKTLSPEAEEGEDERTEEGRGVGEWLPRPCAAAALAVHDWRQFESCTELGRSFLMDAEDADEEAVMGPRVDEMVAELRAGFFLPRIFLELFFLSFSLSSDDMLLWTADGTAMGARCKREARREK